MNIVAQVSDVAPEPLVLILVPFTVCHFIRDDCLHEDGIELSHFSVVYNKSSCEFSWYKFFKLLVKIWNIALDPLLL